MSSKRTYTDGQQDVASKNPPTRDYIYKVISGSTINALEAQLNDIMKSGGVALGGISYVQGEQRLGDAGYYIQAVNAVGD